MTKWLDPSATFTGTSEYNECGLTGVHFNSINSDYKEFSILYMLTLPANAPDSKWNIDNLPRSHKG